MNDEIIFVSFLSSKIKSKEKCEEEKSNKN